MQCLGKADTRTASPTALAITIRRGGKKSCLIRPRESFKKIKKKILSQLGLKNFFSKKTTPRGQKLHFSHMLGVGIGSRFLGVFFKRTNYGGVLQFWRQSGLLLTNCDRHFIVKKQEGGGRGAGRGSAVGSSKVTLKGTAAAASCNSFPRAPNNLLRTEQLQQPALRSPARLPWPVQLRVSTTEREGRRFLP